MAAAVRRRAAHACGNGKQRLVSVLLTLTACSGDCTIFIRLWPKNISCEIDDRVCCLCECGVLCDCVSDEFMSLAHLLSRSLFFTRRCYTRNVNKTPAHIHIHSFNVLVIKCTFYHTNTSTKHTYGAFARTHIWMNFTNFATFSLKAVEFLCARYFCGCCCR